MEQIKLYYHVLDQGEGIIYDLSSILKESIMVKRDKPTTEEEYEGLKEQIVQQLQKHEKICEALESDFLEVYLVDEHNVPYYVFHILNEDVREAIFNDEGGTGEVYEDMSEVDKYAFMYIKDDEFNDYTVFLEDNELIVPFNHFPFLVRSLQKAEWKEKPFEIGKNMYTDGSIVSFKDLQNQKKWSKEEINEANQ